MSIEEITVEELAGQLEAGAPLIDVREPDEFEAARVPGARLIPLAMVPNNVDAFVSSSPVYVICKAGGRSLRACEFVVAHGATAINVTGGTAAWIESGRVVESGPLVS